MNCLPGQLIVKSEIEFGRERSPRRFDDPTDLNEPLYRTHQQKVNKTLFDENGGESELSPNGKGFMIMALTPGTVGRGY